MSLKAFHLFFVIVSVAMTVFVAGWAVKEMLDGAGAGAAALAALCAVATVALVVYGVRVRAKLRYLGEPPPELRVVK